MKILFVCHGNICRSPMAEFCFRKMLRDTGLDWQIASAATSTEELGNPVYPPVRRLLNNLGIDCSGKYARQLQKSEYGSWDLFIGMDNANMRNMQRIFGGDPENKLYRLMDFTDTPGEVSDPWYSGDFQTCYRDVDAGCRALLDNLLGK